MFLGIRDAKQGAKPWGAEGALVVEATQLSCAKTDKANQIAVSREQGLRVFCQTSGFDNGRSNTALFLTSSDRSAMPGAVSSYYGPGNGSRPNAFWPKLLDPVNVPVCPLVTSHMSKDKETDRSELLQALPLVCGLWSNDHHPNHKSLDSHSKSWQNLRMESTLLRSSVPWKTTWKSSPISDAW